MKQFVLKIIANQILMLSFFELPVIIRFSWGMMKDQRTNLTAQQGLKFFICLC